MSRFYTTGTIGVLRLKAERALTRRSDWESRRQHIPKPDLHSCSLVARKLRSAKLSNRFLEDLSVVMLLSPDEGDDY